MPNIGAKRWVIPEGYIPPQSMVNADHALKSHEAICILNAGDENAEVKVTLYFSDKAPTGPYVFSIPAQRTRHLRFNDFNDPEPLPAGTEYSSVIESDRPVVVQHTRLDSRAAEVALMTTLAWPSP